MERDKLSKLKYIYELYTTSCGQVAVEHYPIIYMNRRYIYVKRHGALELMRIDLHYHAIFDILDESSVQKAIDYISKHTTYFYGYRVYGFSISDGFHDLLSEYNSNLEILKIKAHINDLEQRKNQLSIYIQNYDDKIKLEQAKLEHT